MVLLLTGGAPTILQAARLVNRSSYPNGQASPSLSYMNSRVRGDFEFFELLGVEEEVCIIE